MKEVNNPHWKQVKKAIDRAVNHVGEEVPFLQKDGRRATMRYTKDDSLVLTLPVDARSPGDRAAQHRSSCDYFSFLRGECDLTPQREALLKEKINHLRNGAHDENGARDLENGLAALKRQATHNPGVMPLSPLDRKRFFAAIAEKNREEARQEQAVKGIRDRRMQKQLPPTEEIKPVEDESVEDFMKRCVVTKTPEECRELWLEAHPETEGSEGEARSETANFDKFTPEPVEETDEKLTNIVMRIKARKRNAIK